MALENGSFLRVEGECVDRLFVKNPRFAGHFYYFMSSHLAVRAVELEECALELE